jgi:DNA (cytosine-5)-methyltransferase 1
LRAKRRNYVPAFVAINQTTILGKERRKLLVSEAAKLQGFGGKIQFGKQSPAVSFKQIGNAVHPGVVSFVLEKLVQQSIDLTGLTFKKRA